MAVLMHAIVSSGAAAVTANRRSPTRPEQHATGGASDVVLPDGRRLNANNFSQFTQSMAEACAEARVLYLLCFMLTLEDVDVARSRHSQQYQSQQYPLGRLLFYADMHFQCNSPEGAMGRAYTAPAVPAAVAAIIDRASQSDHFGPSDGSIGCLGTGEMLVG